MNHFADGRTPIRFSSCLYFLVFGLAACAGTSVAQGQSIWTDIAPLYLEMKPERSLTDEDSVPLILADQSTPVSFYLIYVKRPGVILQKPLDIEALLPAFRVTVQDAVTYKVLIPDSALQKSVQIAKQGDRAYAYITIRPEKQWPTGPLIMSSSLDRNWIKANLHLDVEIPADSQAFQLRFRSRLSNGAEDRRRLKRFNLDISLGNRPYSFKRYDARAAVEELLQEFPDDLFGHAYAGEMKELIYMGRLRSLQKGQESIPDPEIIQGLTEARRHFAYIQDALTNALLKTNKDLLGDLTPNSEYRSLKFEAWKGNVGPNAVLGYFNRRVRDTDAMLQAANSKLILSLEDLTNTEQILRFLQKDNKVAAFLKNAGNGGRSSWLDNHSASTVLSPEQRLDLLYFLNNVIFGAPIYVHVDLKDFNLSDRTQRLIYGRAGRGEERLQVNRYILEDLLGPTIAHLP